MLKTYAIVALVSFLSLTVLAEEAKNDELPSCPDVLAKMLESVPKHLQPKEGEPWTPVEITAVNDWMRDNFKGKRFTASGKITEVWQSNATQTGIRFEAKGHEKPIVTTGTKMLWYVAHADAKGAKVGQTLKFSAAIQRPFLRVAGKAMELAVDITDVKPAK